MPTQKRKVHRRSHRHQAAYWLLLLVGGVAAVCALQGIALWLPWRWAYGFAANATVWPILQLAVVLFVLFVALGFFYLLRRATAWVFVAIGASTLIPVIQMFVVLAHYADTNTIAIDVAAQSQLTRASYAPDADVQYAEVDGASLGVSIYRNEDIAKRSPAILFVHGGGWSGGARTENSELFAWLNSLGYSVFSIDYRYAHERYASWRDAPRDVACALVWLGRNAESQQIDRDNVTIMGDSAGGQLALRAAYGVKSGDLRPSCEGGPVIPHKAIAIVPAIDFRELYDDPRLGSTSRSNVVRYLGGSPETAAEAYAESSVITHVKSGLQPTLIINAANDTLVSPGSGERLARALGDAGVDVQQYTLPYTVHSYWINPGGMQNQISRELIIRFLAE